MTTLILAVPALLTGTAIGGLALLVLGIRRSDRSIHLAHMPCTQLEATTRRVLGLGVRSPGHRKEGDEL